MAFKNERFRKIVGTKRHSANIYRKEEVLRVTWENTNQCLLKFEECLGLKTGVTAESGACLATYWKYPTRELIIVVNKCGSMEKRFDDSLALAEYFKDLPSF